MVGRDRDELGEGEHAGLGLRDGPGRAVGLLDLVGHRLHRRDADEPAGDHLRAEPAHPVAEAEPLLRRRPAAADAGVHDHEPGDPVGLLDREAEPDRAAPVLDDDGGVAQVELLDEPRDRAEVEVVRVVLEPERLVGAAEAEVVGGDRACGRRQLRDDRAVEVRPGRLAVEQQHRRAGALVEIVQTEAVLLDVVRLEVVAGEAVELLVGRAVGLHRRDSTRTGIRAARYVARPMARAPRDPPSRPGRRDRHPRRWGPEDEVFVEQTVTSRRRSCRAAGLRRSGPGCSRSSCSCSAASARSGTSRKRTRRRCRDDDRDGRPHGSWCRTSSARPPRRRLRRCAKPASRRTWSPCRGGGRSGGRGRRAGSGGRQRGRRRARPCASTSRSRAEATTPATTEASDDGSCHDRGDDDRGDDDGSGRTGARDVPGRRRRGPRRRGARRSATRACRVGASVRALERAARDGSSRRPARRDRARARETPCRLNVSRAPNPPADAQRARRRRARARRCPRAARPGRLRGARARGRRGRRGHGRLAVARRRREHPPRLARRSSTSATEPAAADTTGPGPAMSVQDLAGV